jgi:hypothetical protein
MGDLQGWNHLHHGEAPTGSVYVTSGVSQEALPFSRFRDIRFWDFRF